MLAGLAGLVASLLRAGPLGILVALAVAVVAFAVADVCERRPVKDFRILIARWGADHRWDDVTDPLSGKVVNFRLETVASVAELDADPARQTPKTLQVCYQARGREQWTAFDEGHVVSLP